VRNWRRRIWQPALKACELDTAMVPYDLRHSFASLLIHEGRDIAYIADQLGHSPAMTLATYTHVMRELQDQDRVGAEEQIRHARAQVWPARLAQ
jgi:integrase